VTRKEACAAGAYDHLRTHAVGQIILPQ